MILELETETLHAKTANNFSVRPDGFRLSTIRSGLGVYHCFPYFGLRHGWIYGGDLGLRA